MTSMKLFRGALLCMMVPALVLSAGCGNDDDNPAMPAPSVHEDLVTIWRALSVTVDGDPADLGDFFEFSPGAVTFNLIIDADTSYRGEEIDSVTDPAGVIYYEEGTAVSVGEVLTLTKTSENGVELPHPEVVAVGTWEVIGNRMTFTMEEEGHIIVITWSNWRT